MNECSPDVVMSGHCCLVGLGYVARGWLHSTAANSDRFSGRRVNTISWCDTIPGIRFLHYTNTFWHAVYGVSHEFQLVSCLPANHVAVCPPDIWRAPDNSVRIWVLYVTQISENTCLLLILTRRFCKSAVTKCLTVTENSSSTGKDGLWTPYTS